MTNIITTIPNVFSSGSTAVAEDVQTNFTSMQSQINTNSAIAVGSCTGNYPLIISGVSSAAGTQIMAAQTSVAIALATSLIGSSVSAAASAAAQIAVFQTYKQTWAPATATGGGVSWSVTPNITVSSGVTAGLSIIFNTPAAWLISSTLTLTIGLFGSFSAISQNIPSAITLPSNTKVVFTCDGSKFVLTGHSYVTNIAYLDQSAATHLGTTIKITSNDATVSLATGTSTITLGVPSSISSTAKNWGAPSIMVSQSSSNSTFTWIPPAANTPVKIFAIGQGVNLSGGFNISKGQDTVVTCADFATITAHGGSSFTGGTATGGTYNYTGTNYPLDAGGIAWPLVPLVSLNYSSPAFQAFGSGINGAAGGAAVLYAAVTNNITITFQSANAGGTFGGGLTNFAAVMIEYLS